MKVFVRLCNVRVRPEERLFHPTLYASSGLLAFGGCVKLTSTSSTVLSTSELCNEGRTHAELSGRYIASYFCCYSSVLLSGLLSF